MKRFLSIYKTCIGTAIAEAAAYRLNFLLSLLIAMCFNLALPLITLLIYGAGASFPGWNLYEMLLLQSVFLMSGGLAFLLLEGLMYLTMDHVRSGTFETVLLRPLSPLIYFAVTSFNPQSFSTIVGGIALFIFALYHTGISSISALWQFSVLFAAGFCVQSGAYLIMAATSFVWVGNSRIYEILDSVMTFGKYPAGIFPQTVRAATTFVVPVAMIGYYPASALLGQDEPTAFLAVIPSALFLLFGIWLYKLMVRRYEGVGG